MSRVGKMPIPIPSGVTVQVDDGTVQVKGPKGTLSIGVLKGTQVTVTDGVAQVTAEVITRNPMFGTMRARLANMVIGVSTGFSKSLEIQGTGYRALMEGKRLVLQLGFSHPIHFDPPEGINVKVDSPTKLTVSGADKVLVGQVAANIRNYRPPEPYKGKGIRYEGEYVRRKAGKAAGAAS